MENINLFLTAVEPIIGSSLVDLIVLLLERFMRELHKSSTGQLIDAGINKAINILPKAFGD